MLVLNLAFCDFIMMFTVGVVASRRPRLNGFDRFCFLRSQAPVFIMNAFNEGPIFGKLGCDMYGLIGAYSGIGASTTNAAIAYDRYRLEMPQVVSDFTEMLSYYCLNVSVSRQCQTKK